MTIWIIALVLLVMFAGMGYTAGAIRSAVSLLGLFVAAGLCVPLGPTVQFVFPMFGYTHPLVPVIFVPIIVFFLFFFFLLRPSSGLSIFGSSMLFRNKSASDSKN